MVTSDNSFLFYLTIGSLVCLIGFLVGLVVYDSSLRRSSPSTEVIKIIEVSGQEYNLVRVKIDDEKHQLLDGGIEWEYFLIPVEESNVQEQDTKSKTFNSPIPDGYELVKKVKTKITAYTPGPESCGPYADGKTSLGDDAWDMDGVAVAPKAIPYRTKIFIPGVGIKEADDTGGAMRQAWRNNKTYHIDLRMKNRDDALQWGVKEKTIFILRRK